MSEREPIQPALTPEEWARRVAAIDADTSACLGPQEPENPSCVAAWAGRADYLNANCDNCVTWHHGVWANPAARHALAALCLHGQPFGFSQEDVAELADLARSWDQEAEFMDEHYNGEAMSEDGRGIWRKGSASCRRRAAHARSLQLRIAALLPPPR